MNSLQKKNLPAAQEAAANSDTRAGNVMPSDACRWQGRAMLGPDAAPFSSLTAESESESSEEVGGECDISALMTVCFCTKTLQITVWVNQTFPNYSFGMFTLNGKKVKNKTGFLFVLLGEKNPKNQTPPTQTKKNPKHQSIVLKVNCIVSPGRQEKKTEAAGSVGKSGNILKMYLFQTKSLQVWSCWHFPVPVCSGPDKESQDLTKEQGTKTKDPAQIPQRCACTVIILLECGDSDEDFRRPLTAAQKAVCVVEMFWATATPKLWVMQPFVESEKQSGSQPASTWFIWLSHKRKT